MEADLQRHYGIDYRDRWRPDEHGRPRLTLRRLNVLIRHVPLDDSAVTRALNDGPVPSQTDILLAEIWSLWTEKGVVHPLLSRLRALASRPTGQRLLALAAARKRARERRRKIEAGEIT